MLVAERTGPTNYNKMSVSSRIIAIQFKGNACLVDQGSLVYSTMNLLAAASKVYSARVFARPFSLRASDCYIRALVTSLMQTSPRLPGFRQSYGDAYKFLSLSLSLSPPT